jgi:hypothetical protein
MDSGSFWKSAGFAAGGVEFAAVLPHPAVASAMATPNAAITERLPGLHTRVLLNRPRRPDGVVTNAPCSLVENADSIMWGIETVNIFNVGYLKWNNCVTRVTR